MKFTHKKKPVLRGLKRRMILTIVRVQDNRAISLIKNVYEGLRKSEVLKEKKVKTGDIGSDLVLVR